MEKEITDKIKTYAIVEYALMYLNLHDSLGVMKDHIEHFEQIALAHIEENPDIVQQSIKWMLSLSPEAKETFARNLDLLLAKEVNDETRKYILNKLRFEK